MLASGSVALALDYESLALLTSESYINSKQWNSWPASRTIRSVLSSLVTAAEHTHWWRACAASSPWELTHTQNKIVLVFCSDHTTPWTIKNDTSIQGNYTAKIIRSLTWFFRNTLAKFRTFSAPLSNFGTFQVLINPTSNFRTCQDQWEPCYMKSETNK